MSIYVLYAFAINLQSFRLLGAQYSQGHTEINRNLFMLGGEQWLQKLPPSLSPCLCTYTEQKLCTANQKRYRNCFSFSSLYCSVTLQRKCAWGFGMYCPSGWVHSPANTKFRVAKCLECFVSKTWCIFRTEWPALQWALSFKETGLDCGIALSSIDLGCTRKLFH